MHVSGVFQNPKHITGTVSHLTYSKALSDEAAGTQEGAVPWRREKGMPEPASHCPVQPPRGDGRPAAILT